MGRFAWHLVIGLSVVAVTAGCGSATGSSGGGTRPGRSQPAADPAPGDHHTIVIDSATSLCDLDRDRLAQHLPQHVSVTGAA
jgi:phosphoribosyl 1,2-cyclic phosphodiesterase